MFGAGQRQIRYHVQAVPTTRSPARHHADDHLGHEPDEPLHLKYVEAAGTGRIDALGPFTAGVLVAVAPPDALVSARAERPSTVTRRGAVTGQQHTTHIGRLSGMIESAVQL